MIFDSARAPFSLQNNFNSKYVITFMYFYRISIANEIWLAICIGMTNYKHVFFSPFVHNSKQYYTFIQRITISVEQNPHQLTSCLITSHTNIAHNVPCTYWSRRRHVVEFKKKRSSYRILKQSLIYQCSSKLFIDKINTFQHFRGKLTAWVGIELKAAGDKVKNNEIDLTLLHGTSEKSEVKGLTPHKSTVKSASI